MTAAPKSYRIVGTGPVAVVTSVHVQLLVLHGVKMWTSLG